MEQSVKSHSKLEKARTFQKQLQTNGTKECLLWVAHDIDRYSVVLDSVNCHLKYTISLIVGKEMGYNKKSSFSTKIILLWVLRVFRTARYHRLYS